MRGEKRSDKLKRLESVARMYYERELTQADIARRLGVSRPFVSRLLAEAKQAGVVEIRINPQAPRGQGAIEQVKAAFRLLGGAAVADAATDGETNQLLSLAALDLISQLGGGRIGIGWGYSVGTLATLLERRPPAPSNVTEVTPLIGNSGVPIRHYHSNENTRIIAARLEAQAHYLHAPSLAETAHELDLLRQTEHYRSILAQWRRLDIALVNIGNPPSTPDFASVARYGDLLTARHAVGRLVAYFYDRDGEIIHSDRDYAIQIPLEILSTIPRVIGITSANVSPEALAGALRTELLTDVVASKSALRAVLGTERSLGEYAKRPRLSYSSCHE